MTPRERLVIDILVMLRERGLPREDVIDALGDVFQFFDKPHQRMVVAEAAE